MGGGFRDPFNGMLHRPEATLLRIGNTDSTTDVGKLDLYLAASSLCVCLWKAMSVL